MTKKRYTKRFVIGRKTTPAKPKKEHAAELAQDVAEFLEAGGEITECEPTDDLEWRDYYAGSGIGRMSFVYFIQAGYSGPVKIGVAYDPVERMKELQVGNHQELRLVGIQLGTPSDEKQLHGFFADLHIRGEWFRPEEVLLKYVKNANRRIAEYLNHFGFGVEKVK